MHQHHEGVIEHIQRIVDAHLALIKEKASPEFARIVAQVPIRVLWDSPQHNLYGDFFGVPLDDAALASGAAADIVLYASTIWEEAKGDAAELQHMTIKTLMHELGHYLGLDHEELGHRGLA